MATESLIYCSQNKKLLLNPKRIENVRTYCSTIYVTAFYWPVGFEYRTHEIIVPFQNKKVKRTSVLVVILMNYVFFQLLFKRRSCSHKSKRKRGKLNRIWMFISNFTIVNLWVLLLVSRICILSERVFLRNLPSFIGLLVD